MCKSTFMGCSWKSDFFHFFLFLNLTFAIICFCNFFNQSKYWTFGKSKSGVLICIFPTKNSIFVFFGPKSQILVRFQCLNYIFDPNSLRCQTMSFTTRHNMYSVSDKIIISFSLFLYSESGILSRISNFRKYFSLKLLLDNR